MIKTIVIEYEDIFIKCVPENFNYLTEIQTKYHNEIINKKFHELMGLIKSTGYIYTSQKYPYRYFKNSGSYSTFIALDIINSRAIKNKKELILLINTFNSNTNEEYNSLFNEDLEWNNYTISYRKGEYRSHEPLLKNPEEHAYKNSTSLDILEFYKIIIGHTRDFNNLISTIKMMNFLKESSKNE